MVNEFFTGLGSLIGKILPAFIVGVFSYIFIRTLTAAMSRFGKRSALPDNVISLINKIVTSFIAFISIVLILDIFNFNVAAFVASFGIVGLIIGIGAQSVISNFIAGVFIQIEKPFIKGDFIDITGFQGNVEQISIRNTLIRTFDGRLITIPNSTFNVNAVTNYSRTGEIQVKIPLSFSTSANLVKVSEIVSAVAKSIQGVRQHNVEVLITGITLSDSEWIVGVELRFWINLISNRDDVVSKILVSIKEELAKEKLIPISSGAEEESKI